MHSRQSFASLAIILILCLAGTVYFLAKSKPFSLQDPKSLLGITKSQNPFSSNATSTNNADSFSNTTSSSNATTPGGPANTKIPASHFHLLIPATSSNKYLCQLLLSAAVLDYPVPTLLNWVTEEDKDPFVQHIAKITKTLQYLKGLPSESNNDLVLIVDGYDVWFQLRPDVLIRRYFAASKALDDKMERLMKPGSAKKHGFRHSVLFGSEKLCWPDAEGKRTACWVVPGSPLPRNAFGHYDDRTPIDANRNPVETRPRWLNSGTIMGTVADVKAVLEAASAMTKASHEQSHDGFMINSDQYFLANLFGDQEYARNMFKAVPDVFPPGTIDEPDIAPGSKIEYHIGLDYQSSLFQTVGNYATFLAWLFFDKDSPQKVEPLMNPHGYKLADDIATSPLPFSKVEESQERQEDDDIENMQPMLPSKMSWEDIPLATNLITRQVFAIVHFTFEKGFRDLWWKEMWYFPFGKELLQASARAPRARISHGVIHGRTWWNADATPKAARWEIMKSRRGKYGGAWSDKAMWIPWDGMCKKHEQNVFWDIRE